MKKGFSLVELVFVIVIIGILATIAITRFSNIGEQARANSIMKIITDAESSIPSAYVSLVDMELNTSVVSLSDFISITNQDWIFKDNNNTLSYKKGGVEAYIKLSDVNRTLSTYLSWKDVNDTELKNSFNIVTGSTTEERNRTIPF